MARGWSDRVLAEVRSSSLHGVALINALRVEPELGTPGRGGLPATMAERLPDGRGWRQRPQDLQHRHPAAALAAGLGADRRRAADAGRLPRRGRHPGLPGGADVGVARDARDAQRRRGVRGRGDPARSRRRPGRRSDAVTVRAGVELAGDRGDLPRCRPLGARTGWSATCTSGRRRTSGRRWRRCRGSNRRSAGSRRCSPPATPSSAPSPRRSTRVTRPPRPGPRSPSTPSPTRPSRWCWRRWGSSATLACCSATRWTSLRATSSTAGCTRPGHVVLGLAGRAALDRGRAPPSTLAG